MTTMSSLFRPLAAGIGACMLTALPGSPSSATGRMAPVEASAAASAGSAVDAADLAVRIDAFLSESYPVHEPGAAVIVVRDGEVVFRGAYGMADLELGVPLEPNMVFRLGSITKQFTAAAILMLEQAGELEVSDPITKFLPDYPVHGHTITVAHLLSHSSGIKSYTGIPGWMATKIRADLTIEELVDGFKSEPMDFAPGERFLYNNSGYVLLGAIIEAVSGQSYEQFVEENIFEPLAMESSYYGSRSEIIPRRASGYGGSPGAWENAPFLSMTQPYAAGSLLSTVDDLAKWDAALYTDQLLNEESREKQSRPFGLINGESTGYAYGLSVGELRGRPMISHGGGIFGFRTNALRLPEERLYVAVLSNSTASALSPGHASQKIAAMAIGDPFPERKAIDVAPEILDTYTGVYRIDDNTTRTVTLVEGRLHTQRTGGSKRPILPESDRDFFYENTFTHLTFVTDANGSVSHMLVYPNGSREPERADLTDEPLPEQLVAEIDTGVYDDYVGDYELRPGFSIAITREGGRLFAQATGQIRAELFPTSTTEFFLKVVDAQITFVRGDDGRVHGLVLHQGGQEIEGQRRR